MANLTTPITVASITALDITALDVVTGLCTLQVSSSAVPPSTRSYTIRLSDVAGQSNGLGVNPNPLTWDERVIILPAVGVVNAYLNALSIFFTAPGNKAARLHAVMINGVTDGWLVPALLVI